eukprot:4334521-Amphidinium_carterae.1
MLAGLKCHVTLAPTTRVCHETYNKLVESCALRLGLSIASFLTQGSAFEGEIAKIRSVLNMPV